VSEDQPRDLTNEEELARAVKPIEELFVDET
jgi:hypothetical protein